MIAGEYMRKSEKKAFMMIILCYFIIIQVFAGTYYVEWDAREIFSDSSYVKYKINNGKWNDLDMTEPVNEIVYRKNNKIQFISSLDGENWSAPLSVSLKVSNPNVSDEYLLNWSWNEVPGAKSVRYRINDGEWTYIQASNNGFSEQIKPNTIRYVTVQSTEDGINWLDGKSSGIIIAEEKEIPKTRNLAVTLAGSFFWRDIYFTESRVFLMTGLSFGYDASLFIPVSNTWGITMNNQFAYYRLGFFDYLEYAPSISFRFGSYTEKGPGFYFLLGPGASLVKKENTYYCYPSANFGAGIDWWFSKTLALTTKTDASISIQSDRLLNPGSLIDSISINVTGAVGITFAFCGKGENK